MTVKEFIVLLQKIDQSLPIGVEQPHYPGYYGIPILEVLSEQRYPYSDEIVERAVIKWLLTITAQSAIKKPKY